MMSAKFKALAAVICHVVWYIVEFVINGHTNPNTVYKFNI